MLLNELTKIFSVPNKKDPNETVNVHRYVLDPTDKPTAILYGKFSPWTGPNGHGRLLEFSKDYSRDIVIVSPKRAGDDPEVDIFTEDQKEEIIKKANPGIKFIRVDSGFPPKAFSELLKMGIKRPVFCVGPDRIKDMKKYFIKFDKDNQSISDIDNPKFGKGEFIASEDRGSDTSATKVRKALITNNKKEFLRLTEYDDDMWYMMKKMLRNNNKSEQTSYVPFNNHYITEGGNVVVNGENADHIPIDKITEQQFLQLREDITNVLSALNETFLSTYGRPLFPKFKENIKSKKLFSGSTRLFFDKDFDVFKKYKKVVGDLDIQHPEKNSEDLHEFLIKSKGKKFGGMILFGNGGNSQLQENTIFKTKNYPNILENLQIDFEPTTFKNGVPTEFATFSHYSSWTDMKSGIKGAFAKFLLRALVSSKEKLIDNNIAVLTPTGKISKSQKYNHVGIRKFSVDKGVRIAFEPVLDDEDNITKTDDGKLIYNELDTSDSIYEQDLNEIFQYVYDKTPTASEIKRFHSYIGMLDMMKEYYDIETSKKVYDGFMNLIWSESAQETDRGSFDERGIQIKDFNIKKAAYDQFVKVFPEFKMTDKQLLDYVMPFYNALKVKITNRKSNEIQ